MREPVAISKVSKRVYTRPVEGGDGRPKGRFELKTREPTKGFEPPTHALRKHCSTPELRRRARLAGWLRARPSISIDFATLRGCFDRRGRAGQTVASGQCVGFAAGVRRSASGRGGLSVWRHDGVGRCLVGAGGADAVLRLAVVTVDLARRGVGSTTEGALPIHRAWWYTRASTVAGWWTVTKASRRTPCVANMRCVLGESCAAAKT